MNEKDMMAKVAQHNPEAYDFLMKTAEEIRNSPFKEEIVEEMRAVMEKAAGMFGEAGEAAGRFARGAGEGAKAGWKSLPKPVRLIGALVGAGAALNVGGDLADKAQRGLTKGRHFRKMLEENPDLRKKKDSTAIKKHFSTLHRFNPEYASDPNVAGSYVRQNLGLANDDIQNIHGLVKARNDVKQGRGLGKVSLKDLG